MKKRDIGRGFVTFEPLPVYHEPKESPISASEIAKGYPLILTTGFRLCSFFHSAWTNVPGQRELYPYSFSPKWKLGGIDHVNDSS